MPKSYKMHHGVCTLEYAEISGYCSIPDRLIEGDDDGLEVVIDSRTRGKLRMIALIHEFLHIECPNMSEEDVDRISTNIGEVLNGEGYRNKDGK